MQRDGGQSLLSIASDRTNKSALKWHQGRFRLNMRENVFMERVVRLLTSVLNWLDLKPYSLRNITSDMDLISSLALHSARGS